MRPINAIVEYDGNTVPDGYELVENIITNGNAVKTGRLIDGHEEYIKRIALDSFPGNNATKTWASGISMTNLIMTDLKITVFSGSQNWFTLPNNDTVNSRTQLNANGDISITCYQGNLNGRNGYAEITYFYTS